MPIRRTNKTRKNCKKNESDYHKDAKKGTQLKCRLKTCIAKKYQGVYGADTGGGIRADRHLGF